jgi:hypothetical protein
VHRFALPEGCHWNDIREVPANVGAALQRAMQEIERANTETLFRVFGSADWGNKEKFSDELLKDLIEGFSEIGLGNSAVRTDVLGDAYEYLVGKFADVTRRNKAGEFYTPRSVVRMMVEILDPQESESIYDPACGTGGMLLGAIEHVMRKGGDPRTFYGKIYGQEKNLTTAAIARMNLVLHGIEDFQVAREDTLRNPAFTDSSTGGLATFDCVIANPPFSLKEWGRDLWEADPWGRAQYGIPPESYGDHAFVQHMIASMAPTGNSRKHRIKIIARYQQVDGVNKIVARVVAGQPRKGLIWHFQGSGKSLLMLFAARKLRLHPALKNPTVLIVVDRIDLDSQISGTFYAADMANMVRTESRKELADLLSKDARKVVITTIHKFAEADGVLNDRDNIIVLVDEAHRTQEGDLGRKMRDALPNAFLFGLTGTPINRADKNTFYAFGADTDEGGYMSRYGLNDSIRDGATKELHFEPRLVDLHIDQKAIEEAYAELTQGLTEEDRDRLGKAAAKMSILVKAPERSGPRSSRR